MVTLLSLLAVLLLPATLAEDCKDGACSKEKGKVPGVLLMQTKPGSLLKSASSIPDISTVLAEVQGLKQQMDTMMSSVQAVQTKVQSCCSCDKVTDTFNRENTGICAVFGDPHFVTFDGAQTTLVGDHVTWLVKTDQMHLQTLEKGSEGFLMGFAAGGPFLQGHRLVVFKDSEHGPVHVTFDGTEILQAEVDEFHNSEVGVSAYRRENWDPELFDDRILNLRTKMPFTIGDFEDRFKNLVTTGVYLITLPNQLHVTITGVDFLSLVISMPKQGGETGYCGNFNGDPDDDAEPVVPQWDKPVGPNLEDLPPAQRLFSNETVLLLLGEEAVRTEARSEEEEMKHKLKRVTECPKVLLQKAEEACSGLTEAYHKFCVFDVCLSQNLASAKSVSAAAPICSTRRCPRFKMAKSLILSVVLLSFFSSGSSKHVKFMNCGEGTATSKVNFVDIDPCGKEPCQLKKGTEATVQVEFIPSNNITAARTVVHGHVGFMWVPFPIAQPDACQDQGITCPMTAGKTYTFKTVLPIKRIYPDLKLIVKWEMHDQDNKVVYCWKIPAQIVSG